MHIKNWFNVKEELKDKDKIDAQQQDLEELGVALKNTIKFEKNYLCSYKCNNSQVVSAMKCCFCNEMLCCSFIEY